MFAALTTSLAQEAGVDTVQAVMDNLWLVIAGCLVFLMQAGFLCLETGYTRQKNNVNVAVKNLTDFCVSCVVFWAVGFGLMFGVSHDGLVGVSAFFYDHAKGDWDFATFFVFQMMFCGAAVTIISGAVACCSRVR